MHPPIFLKWAGGKRKLMPQYQPFLPSVFGRYFEPFLGSGSFYFHLQPERAVLSDVNAELINCWQEVRDHVEALIEQLRLHQDQHCEPYYYRVRSQKVDRQQLDLFAQTLNPLERAARFKYLNATCFNGVYRVNRKDQFNIPIGSYAEPAICKPDLLSAASAAIQSVELHVRDFAHVLHDVQPGDFCYFDPPYIPVSQTSNFTSYTADNFTHHDQIRLRDLAVALVDRGVYVLLSNSDCDLVRTLYSGFALHTVTAARSVNSKSDLRGKVAELLIQGVPKNWESLATSNYANTCKAN